MSKKNRHAKHDDEKDDLPESWGAVHAAIWLVGIAILAWQGWWWPGILVLVALSGVFEAGVRAYLGQRADRQAQQTQAARLAQQRASWLPPTCPQCGGPIAVDTLRWTGEQTASCPYCNANLKPPASA